MKVIRMKLSHNFNREEFQCKCGCGFMAVDVTLLTIAQQLRNEFGITTINSGCRCKEHNIKEGGGEDSFHLLGMAVDLYCENGTIDEWVNFIISIGFGEWVEIVKYPEKGIIHIEIDYRSK